jgi:hypothetical protein
LELLFEQAAVGDVADQAGEAGVGGAEGDDLEVAAISAE